MAEIQGSTGVPWAALSTTIALVTAHRAGIRHLDLPGGQAPDEVITALTALTSELLRLVPSEQADALLRSLGLTALTAGSQAIGGNL